LKIWSVGTSTVTTQIVIIYLRGQESALLNKQ
jgi:hypothetical protein